MVFPSFNGSVASVQFDAPNLTESVVDEGAVLMFFRDTGGAASLPVLMSVEVTGRNLRRAPLDVPGSDPAWSPLLD